jgi:hypothetical protein
MARIEMNSDIRLIYNHSIRFVVQDQRWKEKLGLALNLLGIQ